MTLFMVEIVVSDWHRSREWYRNLLGWPETLVDDKNEFALLEGGGRLALKSGPPQTSTVTPVFRVTDLDAELARLFALGIDRDTAVKVSEEGYRRVFVRDPDGYRIGLFEWNQSTVNELKTSPVGNFG